MSTELTRREMLRLLAVAGAGTLTGSVLLGCGGPAPTEEAAEEAAEESQEAPSVPEVVELRLWSQMVSSKIPDRRKAYHCTCGMISRLAGSGSRRDRRCRLRTASQLRYVAGVDMVLPRTWGSIR